MPCGLSGVSMTKLATGDEPEGKADLVDDGTTKTYDDFGHMLAENGFQYAGEAGEGANGYVFKVDNEFIPGLFWAVKAFPRDAFTYPSSLFTEAEYLDKYRRLIRLPYSAHLCYTSEVLRDHEYLYIVMEWVGGGDCMGLGRVSEGEVRHIAQGALRGLQVLHTHDITHADVSLRNIMRTGERVMLIDFDNIITPHSPKVTRIAGTPQFLAPECFEGFDYSPASDLWAIGVSLYYLLTCRFPFDIPATVPDDGSIEPAVLRAMKRGPRFLPSDGVSAEAADLISKLLTADKKQRMASAAEALAHPWLASDDGTSAWPPPAATALCTAPSSPARNHILHIDQSDSSSDSEPTTPPPPQPQGAKHAPAAASSGPAPRRPAAPSRPTSRSRESDRGRGTRRHRGGRREVRWVPKADR
ncbi:unnamed protein product [Vitrella brassicaformis CCMP3155]|uniref:Protein kinase domain-containing protein n=1 Tax=Vitrella brassicaformis (strain CCMP3155) TaxID=1169540 RepID=A0A0G4EM56_VITBC|nr:unnamed protein product [Vitrella brassicaformis CCMP3155]|eukprot:CEL98530.1 unnamed protein product [Vitrella brassicaformis CCMP3155]